MYSSIKTLLILLLSSFILFAQSEATTKDGKKVILNENGTWKLAKEPQRDDLINHKCNDLISTRTDKVTGRTSTSNRSILQVKDDNGEGFSMLLLTTSSDDDIIFNITVVGASSCIDEDDAMLVLFRDGTRLQIENDTDYNCNGNFTVYFGSTWGKISQRNTFSKKEVETMRIWTFNGFVEMDFSSEQSKQLMKTFECLINN